MSLPSLEEARRAVAVRLSPNERAHSEGVALTAEEMASRWGADPRRALIAGMLHDWDKETAPAELLLEARRFGIEVTETDAREPYLLHAPVSARHVDEAFPGIEREVLTAIAKHTLGARDMSPMDMVVYLADTLEPGRDHEGVEELRQAAARLPLAEAFRMTYTRSVRNLVDQRRVIHPTTVAVWNSLVAETSA